MDLTPTTPVTKRIRTKAPSVVSESAKKLTLTIKKPRVRKKAVAAEAAMTTPALSAEQLSGMIATAAYFRAVQRNFAPGGEIDDWLAAEREVLGRS